MLQTEKLLWLVEIIYSYKKITRSEIDNIYKIKFGKPLSRKTFNRWKDQAEELFGINIKCEAKTYKYYIEDIEKKDDIRKWILDNMLTSTMFMNDTSLREKIISEEIPRGGEYMKTIIDALKTNHILRVTHKDFTSEKEHVTDCMPLCLKLNKQRWYMLFQYYNEGNLRRNIYSLDRILNIETLEDTFVYPEDFEPSDFFKHLYGVFINHAEEEPPTVRIRTTRAFMKGLLRSLPLHHSQKEVEIVDENVSIFEYHLHPNKDFKIELFKNGCDLEVLEPATLRDEIIDEIQKMQNLYNETE